MLPLMRVNSGDTADKGSIAATLVSPLMRREKIKIKNKKVISGNINEDQHKVAADEGLLAETLVLPLMREKIEIKNKKGD